MKGFCIIIWLTSIILLSCKSNAKKEINSSQPTEQEKTYSKVKFSVECYGSKPTVEELFFYYEMKNREYIALLKREKEYEHEPIDLPAIRRSMVANNPGNPYIQYDFLNPWKEPPPISRGGRGGARTIWYSPNPSGYRYSAPINVKPGHLF